MYAVVQRARGGASAAELRAGGGSAHPAHAAARRPPLDGRQLRVEGESGAARFCAAMLATGRCHLRAKRPATQRRGRRAAEVCAGSSSHDGRSRSPRDTEPPGDTSCCRPALVRGSRSGSAGRSKRARPAWPKRWRRARGRARACSARARHWRASHRRRHPLPQVPERPKCANAAYPLLQLITLQAYGRGYRPLALCGSSPC